jgi:hypothetical protein
MKKVYARLFIIAASLLLVPTIAEAHVKWFTHITPEKATILNILSPFFILTALFVAVLLAVLTQA